MLDFQTAGNSFVPQSLDWMQSPRALFSGLIDNGDLIFQRANKLVLVGKPPDSKSQMMGQGWQVNLHVNWERFFHGAHSTKGLPSPKASATEHR